jgi:ABC-type multidrug transport system fused ATPase/permease subunit
MATPADHEHDQKLEKAEHLMPLRYVFAIMCMLLILVAAVIIPDLLPYIAPKLGLGTTTNTTQVVNNTPLPSPNTNIFETYARLVTLFLALVSVLGVFFGYFVRKSIRETEEDIDKRFERNLKLWESERDSLLTKYKDDAKELKEKLAIVNELEKRLREAIDTWDDANRRYAQAGAAPAPNVVQVSAQQLDEQLPNAPS